VSDLLHVARAVFFRREEVKDRAVVPNIVRVCGKDVREHVGV
jgi:hypothetical protein